MKQRMLNGHPECASLVASVREVEDFCLQTARLTVAVSDHDADAFSRRRLASGGPIIVVPNGADSPTDPTDDETARAADVGPRSVAFLGSAHMPNVEGLWLLRDVIAPALPDVEFHILGSVGEAAGAVPANIHIWGQVSAGLKTAILWRATIAVNPVFTGGGSNIKMSDYFAHGLPTVTSAFGLRGYPTSITPFVETADSGEFAEAIERLLGRFPPGGPHRSQIASIFAEQLSMAGHAARYAERIRAMDTPRRRLLAVTYRYTDPPLGGAEVMLGELLRRLDQTGKWAIDVVCPDVGTIADRGRFSTDYGSADGYAVPGGSTAIRWRRFGVQRDLVFSEDMRQAWRVQAAFEEALASNRSLRAVGVAPQLLAGWHVAEPDGGRGRSLDHTEGDVSHRNWRASAASGLGPPTDGVLPYLRGCGPWCARGRRLRV